MTLLNHVQATDEYAAIAKFYGERRAERSQVLLINHTYRDPLGRLCIYAQGARGVDLNDIGPGKG